MSSFFRLSRKSLQSLRLPEKSIGAIAGGSAIRAAERELGRLAGLGLRLVTLDSPLYPTILRQIHDPPPALYCAGRVETLSEPSVALVGSRRPTVYGKEVSRKLARELSALGLCVVSGLARGVDSEAHWGALQEEGRTIGVLGCGIDVVYPPENGGVVSPRAGTGLPGQRVSSRQSPGAPPLPGPQPDHQWTRPRDRRHTGGQGVRFNHHREPRPGAGAGRLGGARSDYPAPELGSQLVDPTRGQSGPVGPGRVGGASPLRLGTARGEERATLPGAPAHRCGSRVAGPPDRRFDAAYRRHPGPIGSGSVPGSATSF